MKIPRKLLRILALVAAGVGVAVVIVWVEHSGVLLSDEEMEVKLYQDMVVASPVSARERASLRYHRWIVDHYAGTKKGAEAQYRVANLLAGQSEDEEERFRALEKVYRDFPRCEVAHEAMRWRFRPIWKHDPSVALVVLDDIQEHGFDPVLCRLWRAYCLIGEAYGYPTPSMPRDPDPDLVASARGEFDKAVAELPRPIGTEEIAQAYVEAVLSVNGAQGMRQEGIEQMAEMLNCPGTAPLVAAELREGMARMHRRITWQRGTSSVDRERHYRAAEDLYRQNVEVGIRTPGVSAPLAFDGLVGTMLSRTRGDPEELAKVQAFIEKESQREYLSKTEFDEHYLDRCAKMIAEAKARPRPKAPRQSPEDVAKAERRSTLRELRESTAKAVADLRVKARAARRPEEKEATLFQLAALLKEREEPDEARAVVSDLVREFPNGQHVEEARRLCRDPYMFQGGVVYADALVGPEDDKLRSRLEHYAKRCHQRHRRRDYVGAWNWAMKAIELCAAHRHCSRLCLAAIHRATSNAHLSHRGDLGLEALRLAAQSVRDAHLRCRIYQEQFQILDIEADNSPTLSEKRRELVQQAEAAATGWAKAAEVDKEKVQAEYALGKLWYRFSYEKWPDANVIFRRIKDSPHLNDRQRRYIKSLRLDRGRAPAGTPGTRD